MNRKSWQKTRYASRLVRFLLHSGTRYQVHSPFLYDLINKVIRSNKKFDKQNEIEKIRKECLRNQRIIQKTDYGAGGSDKILYPVEIRKIARNSLSAPHHARRLHSLVKYLKAGKILEIGTSLGITTAYLAAARPDAEIITLEGCPETSELAREYFNKLGINNIRLIKGRFEETLLPALEQLVTVDLVFIDGNHRGEAVLDYFEKCIRYSNNNTVIIVDDIHSSEGMERAWKEITRHEKTRVSFDLFYSGWIILRKELSRQHFRLRYF